jgi:hypothetical protein
MNCFVLLIIFVCNYTYNSWEMFFFFRKRSLYPKPLGHFGPTTNRLHAVRNYILIFFLLDTYRYNINGLVSVIKEHLICCSLELRFATTILRRPQFRNHSGLTRI